MSKQFQCEDKVEAKLPGPLFYSHGAIALKNICHCFLKRLLRILLFFHYKTIFKNLKIFPCQGMNSNSNVFENLFSNLFYVCDCLTCMYVLLFTISL